MKQFTNVEEKFNSLLSVPMEQWKSHGVSLTACSANSDGMVNSCFAVMRQARYHVYRRHEMIEGKFTGKSTFVVEKRYPKN